MKAIAFAPLLAFMLWGSTSSAQTRSGAISGHYYVDLGLPSGLKWATCNVGADQPTQFGDYFAWGETHRKATYNWSTYKWCGNRLLDDDGMPRDFSKYNNLDNYGTLDFKTTLDPADDAATQNWGPAWRTPTFAELEELLKHCNWIWLTNYKGTGVAGNLGTSKTNGNTIFFPATGIRDGQMCHGAGDEGLYWSSSFYRTGIQQGLFVDDDAIALFSLESYSGLSVRAVAK